MPDGDSLGYGDAAQAYWDKGWVGVLPLKRGSKWPPPTGFTGYENPDPSYPDILQWSELYPDGNICLRLPDSVIGIDVDAYGAKTGEAAFAAWLCAHSSMAATNSAPSPLSALPL